ncbi:MAG: UbiA family prenyltransferase [candidate division KSB1 bacterium]
MKRFVKIFDYVFVLRPTLFFPVWTVYAAGYFAYHRFAPSGTNGATQGMSEDAILLLFFLTLLMGSGYILNQLCDVETDARNNKLFLIAQRHVPPFAAWSEMILLLVLGLAVAWQHSLAMGLLFLAIYLVTGIFYNVAPFRMKDRPLLGVFANAAGALLIFAAGWWSMQADWEKVALHALPYMLAVAAVYLYTTLLDLEGDAAENKITFGVKYGWRATVITGCAMEFVAAIIAYVVNDPIILIPSLLAAPFFLMAVIKQRRSDIARAIKLPIAFLALAICFKVWQYLLLLSFVFYFSKWYYHHRFGLKYPSLSAE